MSYSDQIRHPDGALNPQGKKSGLSWWWFVIGGIAALVLIGIFRPEWFVKIGIRISGAGKAFRNINPQGWV